jgi:transposase
MWRYFPTLYQVQLDQAGRRELVRRTRLPNIAPRTRDRLEMVRLSDSGYSVPQIAKVFGAHPQRVRHWIKAFLSGGFDALSDLPHTGMPSAITQDIRAAVKALLEKGDRTWTAQQVADWVAQGYGLTRSAKQWRRVLARMKQSYKRTGRSLDHKQVPEAVEAARQEMAAQKEQAERAERAEKAEKGAANCSMPVMSAISTRQALP